MSWAVGVGVPVVWCFLLHQHCRPDARVWYHLAILVIFSQCLQRAQRLGLGRSVGGGAQRR